MPEDLIVRPSAVPAMRAAFAPGSWNPEARTIDVVWTTGAPVARTDWMTGKRYTEILDVSPEAVDLSRLNAGAPVLNTHSSWDLGDIVGVVVDGSATVEGGEGRATLRLSDRDEVAGIVRDVAAGIIRNISVGYQVSQWAIAEATATTPETRTAVRWTPYELSLVPIPADAGAQTRSLPAPEPAPATQAARAAIEEPAMTDTVNTPAAPAAIDIDSVTRAATAAERKRVAEIMTIARQIGQDADWAQPHIDAGASPDAVRAAALEAVAATSKPLVPAAQVQIVRDEHDTLIQRMSEALTAQRLAGDNATAALPEAKPSEAAREFMGIGMHGMIRELGARAGVKGIHRMSPKQLADLALSKRDFGGQSTSDFAAILTNSTNKFLRASYGSFPQTWRGWTNEYDVADFKTITTAGMGNFPEPQTFAEGDPVPIYQAFDEGETFSVKERGRRIILTRAAIVNDDLRAIDRTVRQAALGGYTALRRAVFGVLTTNANMSDGNALFSAAHANLGSAGPMTSTTISELLQKLEEMTDVSGQPVPPPTSVKLLVAPSKHRTSLELTTSLIVPTAAGNALPMQYRDMINVIVDPFLKTGNDPYYLVREDVPLIDIAYLQGDGRVPVVTSEVEIEYTGVTWRAIFDFGVAASNWRSGAANLG